MRRLPLLLLALLLGISAASAAEPMGASPAAERLLEEGRAHMVAMRFSEAEAAFERLRAGGDPTAAASFHLAKVAWWRALILEQDALVDAYLERYDALQADLRAAPSGPWTGQFRAESELHRAVVLARRGDRLRAANALREAYNHFSRTTRDYPDFEEARWGLGLCYAVVGSVPRPYRGLLRVLGFRGTVPQGMEEIRRSMTRSRYYRDEAAVFYAFLDRALNESQSGGIAPLRAAAERHPESPLMGFLYGVALLTEREAAEAERVLRRAERQAAQPGVFPLPQIGYYLADAQMRQERWAEAASGFERFLSGFPGRANRAQAALRAGLAREMAGDRAAAERHYRAVRVRDEYDTDASARREADARLATPMTGRQQRLLRGRMAYDGGRYREAVATVQPVLTDANAPALDRAEAAYRSGRAFQAQRSWDEAIRHYQFAVHNPGDPLAKWGPWSQLYIAEVEAARGNRDAAREAYRTALANDQPFEYHKGLEQRARTALARL